MSPESARRALRSCLFAEACAFGITDAQHQSAQFGQPAHPPDGPSEGETDRVRSAVEEALGPAPVAVDELIRLCGVPAAAVLTVLLELELAGRLARHPGNRVSWL